MRRLVSLLVLSAGLAAANPVMLTFLNEFSADTLNGQWLELHPLPASGPWDLSGWQVITSTSACTLRCTLDYNNRPYIVIDSPSLAQGIDGTGTFRLNPTSDSIRLIDTTG
jgi:lipocalin